MGNVKIRTAPVFAGRGMNGGIYTAVQGDFFRISVNNPGIAPGEILEILATPNPEIGLTDDDKIIAWSNKGPYVLMLGAVPDSDTQQIHFTLQNLALGAVPAGPPILITFLLLRSPVVTDV